MKYLDKCEDYTMLRHELTPEQLVRLDRIVGKIQQETVILYYHKDTQTGGIDARQPFYIGLKAVCRPYGCEFVVAKWLNKLATTKEVIDDVWACIDAYGSRLISDPYRRINYIGDSVAAHPPMVAVYRDGLKSLYIKDIVWANKVCYAFVVQDNNTLKKCKVTGYGRAMYIVFNKQRYNLNRCEFLEVKDA